MGNAADVSHWSLKNTGQTDWKNSSRPSAIECSRLSSSIMNKLLKSLKLLMCQTLEINYTEEITLWVDQAVSVHRLSKLCWRYIEYRPADWINPLPQWKKACRQLGLNQTPMHGNWMKTTNTGGEFGDITNPPDCQMSFMRSEWLGRRSLQSQTTRFLSLYMLAWPDTSSWRGRDMQMRDRSLNDQWSENERSILTQTPTHPRI